MENLDENRVRDIVKEELANFTPQKRKRAPNKWQIFLKDCVKEVDQELAYPEKVKACSAKYKESKTRTSNNPLETTQQPINQPTTQTVIQSVQPQYMPAQPTYHTQQMDYSTKPLTEEDVERLFVKMVKKDNIV